MDFAPAGEIVSALRSAIEKGDFGYPHQAVIETAAEAMRQWLVDQYDWDVERQDVVTIGGLVHALEAYFLFFAGEKKDVVVPTPSYPPFLHVPTELGWNVIESPMQCVDGRWCLDLDDIERAFAKGAGTLILCNPHNPTGTVFTRAELTSLSEIVEAHGGRVFSDEIHGPLTYNTSAAGEDQRHVPYASVTDAATGHAMTGVSATKGWNMGGINAAHVVVAERDRATAQRLNAMLSHSASTPGLWATAAAYNDGRGWLENLLDYLNENRRRLAELICDSLPGVGYRIPDASYLAWIDFRQTEWADCPSAHISQRARVALVEGADFGSPGPGFARLNFATPYPVLEEILAAISEAFQSTRSTRPRNELI
ncbi:MalY/PatB family protein [Paenarthrobacter nitroguajacolicus]|uniref:MalY/PatB family protein n=1 Tax=Paenarthrobacter nitroguajacolicus TaxID=211146 RepID=UPI00248BF398|nr:aminotransferase class I/II-fold pyridoxal phosphate-dependent enzyme [Paenarthrobacter nitroguajacolicus]